MKTRGERRRKPSPWLVTDLRFSTPYAWRARKHFRTYFFGIMKTKHIIRPTGARENLVGSGRVTPDGPADSEQRRKNLPGFTRRPLRHAARKEIVNGIEETSPTSILSARTRSASACAFNIDSSSDFPYASTPGISTTSAIHRPSSSCSNSMRKFITFSRIVHL